MRKKIYGKRGMHADIAHVLNNIGAEYNNLKNKVEATYYGEKALEMQTKLFEEPDGDHPDLIETLENLSASYSSSEALDEEKSLKYALNAYNMQTRLFPNVDHPRTARLLLSIAQSYSNLAIEANKNRKNELFDTYGTLAIIKKKEACEMQHRIFNGRGHSDLAKTLQSLGESFRKKREFNQALAYFERAYDMRNKIYNERPHQHLIESLNSLHLIHFQLRNEKEANRFESMREDMEERLKVMEKSTRILIPIVQ
jgi:tetratricopeptide (TPR) repeat protein